MYKRQVERLVSALAEIKRRYRTDGSGLLSQEYIDPVVAASPQEAFYAPKKSLPLRETEGMVCSEFVMCYPPGIPILAPGERITDVYKRQTLTCSGCVRSFGFKSNVISQLFRIRNMSAYAELP